MAYAVDTKVPIQQTKQELETLVKKHGAIRVFQMDDVDHAFFGFFMSDRLIKMRLPLPAYSQGPNDRAVDQLRRSRFRTLLMIVRARLEAIEAKISTVEQEFMADIVMPDGRTVGEWMGPQLQIAYERGVMPDHPLMLTGPKP